MINIARWVKGAGILRSDNNKGPWGSGGDSSGGGGSGGSGGGGPRNPWAFPPEGRRPRPGGNPFDDFMKRARRGGNGGGGLPGGGTPDTTTLVQIGIGAVVVLWIALTSFWVIAPNERGVVTVLGRYSTTLEPGFRLTWPAPFASVTKVDATSYRDEVFPKGGTGENLMLTQDQNIVNLGYQVRWDVKNAEDFVFQIADPEETVRAIAESAMRAVIADVTLNEAIGAGRDAIEARVQQNMQAILDEYNSGVRIQKVAINQAVAPSQVDEAFKAVTAAQQEAQATLNNSRAYAQQVIARAQGEAAQFDKIYEQYKLAPEVTRKRLYYETMEAVLAKSNKTIVEAPGVVPYLPLPPMRGRQLVDPEAAETPTQAAPAAGAAR